MQPKQKNLQRRIFHSYQISETWSRSWIWWNILLQSGPHAQKVIARQASDQPSVNKTVSSVFHVHNASIKHEQDVLSNNSRLSNEAKPVYLGVTLDRILTYKAHLQKEV
jgi:hypothetical protein